MEPFYARLGDQLSLYVRALAWLHAAPRPPANAKRPARPDAPPPESRLERMKRAGSQPQMPPNPMPHIIERLFEIGLTEAVGMGVGPISWATINAWQQAVMVTLPPWEARLLRRLSADYVAENRLAEDEGRPPPWRTDLTARDRVAVGARISAAFRAMASAPPALEQRV